MDRFSNIQSKAIGCSNFTSLEDLYNEASCRGHRFIRQRGSSLMDGTQSNARPIRCSPNRREGPSQEEK
ncbi:Peptide chain release factor 3 [Dissostichus eleginoides]|uniref:Peptide chain release factor 3 n=1 Tax=Dissostichus eleginoides TaxID=100907 RepID=A0AAD9EXX8_DISEL|nr:Peptide chain release factor 3 [Dissostichus eleginoides]